MAVMQIAAILLVAVAPWLPESSTLEEHRTPDKVGGSFVILAASWRRLLLLASVVIFHHCSSCLQ